MSDTIIKVENLSKKYQIKHTQSERYVALRDVISNEVERLRNCFSTTEERRSSDKEDFWALEDISFEIKRGDCVGIIGRNGAGKSTLLKVLSRITEPTTGFVELQGRIASLLEVGTGFHPELTGRENIYLNGAILGMNKAEIVRKFDEIVDFAEIEKFLDTPVKRYSSGMYVRLAFAVAAHLEPEILLVDEVLAVGDLEFQKKCLSKMDDVGRSGRTVIFVSHNMSAVKALCSKGIYLEHGHINCMGEIGSTIGHYLSSNQSSNNFPTHKTEKNTDTLAQVISVEVTDEQGTISRQYPYNEPFLVHCNIAIRERASRIYLALHIHDSTLETVIFSRDFETNEKNLLYREKGLHSFSIKIPPALLVPGQYSISLHAALSSPAQVISGVDFVCPFELIDNGSCNAKTGFPWRGKIGIPLHWDENKM